MNSEPAIDRDVDIDELFEYDETKSPEENYENWLSHIYDTFAGIASGDNYLEIVEAFANEKTMSISVDKAKFKDVEGLPPAICGLICELPLNDEDLLHNEAVLSITGAVDYRLDAPLAIKLKVKSHNPYGSEILISKKGEDFDEPIDISSNNSSLGIMSSHSLLAFLISLNELDPKSDSEKELLQLSPIERDAACMVLLRHLGFAYGTTIEEHRLYGALTYANNDSLFSNGVVAVNQTETPKASTINIEIVKHDLLHDLDCEIIYRFGVDIYSVKNEAATSDTLPGAQKAQKIVHAPVDFHVRKIRANMEFDGKVSAMELNKANIVMMIKVVQDLVSNIVDRIDIPLRG